jgi:hypothetical protein
MAKRRQTRYRDTRSGRFVKRSTWKRSRAQGGKRYERETVRIHPRLRGRKTKPAPPPQVGAPTYEWIVTWQPSQSNERSFDIIVTARNDDEARERALEFIASDKNARKSLTSGSIVRVARGRESASHESQYRSKSKE